MISYTDTYAGYGYHLNGDIFSVLLGALLGVVVIVLILYIFTVIGQWKVFSKANKPGWASLIPIYNEVVACEISGINPFWVLIVLLSSLVAWVIPILGLLLSLVSLYFSVILAMSLARSFGKGTGFGLGLLFFSPIFYIILGFGKSTYVGPSPVGDFLFPSKNQSSDEELSISSDVTTNSTSDSVEILSNSSPVESSNLDMNVGQTNVDDSVSHQSSQESSHFCPSCGNPVTEHDRFCSNCGKDLF